MSRFIPWQEQGHESPCSAEKEDLEMTSSQQRNCVSCGRPIAFDANVCPYCGKDYRMPVVAPQAEVGTGMKIFLYLLSFLIPIVGFIIGAIYYTKPEADYKHVGKMCILFGLLSIVIWVVCWGVLFMATWSLAW